MSYILDALKKSEKERQRGSVPSINSQPADMPPRSGMGRSGWLCLVFAVLLLNAVVLLWWLKPWQAGRAGQPPVAEEGKERQIAATDGIAPADSGMGKKYEPETSTSIGPPVSAESPVDHPKEQIGRIEKEKKTETVAGPPVMVGKSVEETPQIPLHLEPENDHPPLAAAADKVAASPATGQNQQAGPEESDSSPLLPNAMEDEDDSGQSMTSAPTLATGPAPSDSEDKPVDDEAGGGEAVFDAGQSAPLVEIPATRRAPDNQAEAASVRAPQDYRQLPLAVQQQLPELQISLHLYAEKPERRKVSIDGRMMREKERIRDDLILEEITPDGVIFNFAGRRFHKGVFR